MILHAEAFGASSTLVEQSEYSGYSHQTITFIYEYNITQLSKMLHNKHLKILYYVLGDYNRELYGRELAKSLSLSQKNIALTLKELSERNIFKSTNKGNLKLYRLNTKNQLVKDILKIAESSRKIEFLERHKVLKHIFNKQDKRVVGIFGSYAKSRAKKESDIDIFVIGKKIKTDYDKLGKEYDLDISIKYFTETEFTKLCKANNPLVKEIISNHILISNVEQFIETLWRDFYGYD